MWKTWPYIDQGKDTVCIMKAEPSQTVVRKVYTGILCLASSRFSAKYVGLVQGWVASWRKWLLSCALTCEKGVWGALLVGGGTQHIGLLSALCSVPYMPLVVKHGAGNIIVTHLINVDRLEGPLLISLSSVALPSHLFS